MYEEEKRAGEGKRAEEEEGKIGKRKKLLSVLLRSGRERQFKVTVAAVGWGVTLLSLHDAAAIGAAVWAEGSR